MSGADNLRGIDYQVAYSLLVALIALKGDFGRVSSFKFESLTEDEEDMNVFFENGSSHFIQVKKRNEGYHWTPSELRDIFEKFHSKNTDSVSNFLFVSNAAGSVDVVELKKVLSGGAGLSEEIKAKFKPKSASDDDFVSLLNKIQISTRFFPSSDDSKPAESIERKIKEILQSHPFQFDGSINDLYRNLWKIVFDLSKNSSKITKEDILKTFRASGLSIISEPWLSMPEVSAYVERRADEIVFKGLLEGKARLHVIYGLSGVGKTSFSAGMAKQLIKLGKRVFWCSINKLTTTNDFVRLLASFTSFHGEQRHSSAILGAERANLAKAVAASLNTKDSYFFLDGVNNLSEELRLLLADALEIFLAKIGAGQVILTSTEIPALYSGPYVEQGQVSEYNLVGLAAPECERLLRENGVELDETELMRLVHAVSGHPFSIKLYCQLFSQDNEGRHGFEELSAKTVSAAQEYLITKAIESLPDEQRGAILRLSVIPYSFSADWIDGFVVTNYSLKLILRELKRKSLLAFDGANYTVHDLVRSSCLSLLSKREAILHNHKMAELLRIQLSEGIEKGNNILYEHGFKWAYHVENSTGANLSGGVLERLLWLKNEELDALWAIDRYGYPFDYFSSELNHSKGQVEKLLQLGFVQPFSGKQDARRGHRSYETIGLANDEFAHVFLVYLCISRGISNHMGYIEMFEPNYACDNQAGVICIWEHCIELMPLPPITRAEHATHIDFLRAQFVAGAYAEKPPEIQEMLAKQIEEGVPDDAPEEPDVEMDAAKCPIFGHCCPGGSEQAAACRAGLDEDEPEAG
ncbi:ATP-binding protein [Trinickia diaoshuihuensis]|uniref:ATP-binding protein n=1 Tax=Trinickia diaoshuihuensis TaxID=2292265 RepID=UPI000E278945|nr:ATP-binding protein [Trinickia diaoshuihuensis]